MEKLHKGCEWIAARTESNSKSANSLHLERLDLPNRNAMEKRQRTTIQKKSARAFFAEVPPTAFPGVAILNSEAQDGSAKIDNIKIVTTKTIAFIKTFRPTPRENI
jgi:hypothetical protein